MTIYRRGELINHFTEKDNEKELVWHLRAGICSTIQPIEVAEAWIDMPGTRKRIGKNGRYYFTEKGWDLYGRKIVKACQRTGQEYRVLKVKENAVEPLYKDDVQVVVRPLKKRP